MIRRLLIATFLAMVLPALDPALAACQALEVATVRPSAPAATRGGIVPTPGGRVNVVALTAQELIVLSYGTGGALFDDQIVGGPDWMRTERFDISAVERTTAPQSGEVGARMLQLLREVLAEHFKLRVHDETRELPVMALVVARSDGRLGPRLQPTATDCAALAASDPMKGCGLRRVAPGVIRAEGGLLGSFANELSRQPDVRRIVIDKTGLSGRYDIDLQFSRDALSATADAPSLFTALQEQMGLRLDAQRAPARVIVVDAIERPAAP
jgi:uncharacterized protein (TIGR03435 family)